MIAKGDSVPAVDITVVNGEGQKTVSAAEYFSGQKVVLFAVPGAFTPTCSASHLPGFVVHADQIKAKGVDKIACLSVNDAFVMNAWREAQNADEIDMLADGGAALSKALGLEMETGDFGGVRCRRFAAIIDNGEVTLLNLEPPKTFESSKAEVILEAL